MTEPPEDEKKETASERAERTAMLRHTILRDTDGEEISVRLRNLSATGFGGAGDKPLVVGHKITAELDGIGPVDGTVVWAEGTSFGIEFDEPIEPEALTHKHRELASMPTPYTVPGRFKPPSGEFRRPGLTRKD